MVDVFLHRHAFDEICSEIFHTIVERPTGPSQRVNEDQPMRWMRHGEALHINSDFYGISTSRLLDIHSQTETMHRIILALRAADSDGMHDA